MAKPTKHILETNPVSDSYKVRIDGSILFITENVIELPSLRMVFDLFDELPSDSNLETIFKQFEPFCVYLLSLSDNHLEQVLEHIIDELFCAVADDADEFKYIETARDNISIYAKSIIKNKFYFSGGIVNG